MADIFISYSRRDQRTAERLAEALRREGWTVWWDAFLYVGREFPDGIRMALEDARSVVVLWSSSSVVSEWVMTEAAVGVERNVLVPAKLDTHQIPKPFERIHAASLIDWDGEKRHQGYTRLTEAITRVAGAPRPLATEPLELATVLEIPASTGLTAAFGSLWVSANRKPGLLRIDPKTRQLISEVQTRPTWSVLAGPDHIWAMHARAVSRISPEENHISAVFRLGPNRGGAHWATATGHVFWLMAMPQRLTPEVYALSSKASRYETAQSRLEVNPGLDPVVIANDRLMVRNVSDGGLSVLSGPPITVDMTLPIKDVATYVHCEDALWCETSEEPTWQRVDLHSVEITAVALPHRSRVLAEANSIVYIACSRDGDANRTVARIDRESGTAEPLHAFEGFVNRCCLGGDYLWIEVFPPARLLQIDLETATLVAEIPLNGSLMGCWYHGGALWIHIKPEIGGELVRVTPATGRVTATLPVGPAPIIEFATDAIWILRHSHLCRWGI